MAVLEGRRIAVTGAGGFIGCTLVDQLTQQGAAVLAISRQPKVPGARTTAVWPAHEDAQAGLLSGCDAVLHLAAVAHRVAEGYANVDASVFAPNLALTRQVAQACGAARVRRLVLVSSIGVHGIRKHEHPFTEADRPAPVDPYAVSKWACEQAARGIGERHGLDVVVVRPPLVHGPRAPGNFGALWHAVSQGRLLPLGAIANQRSLIGIDNLVHLLALCAVHTQACGQTFVAADGEDVSTPELVRRIARAQGRTARLLSVPPPVLRMIGLITGKSVAVDRLTWSLQVDAAKVRRMLGWQPPFTLDEGLTRAAHAEGLR